MIFRHRTQNYTVWYTYVSGREPDLKRAIDKMIGEGTEFSSFENAELFENFSGSLKKAREFRKPEHKSTIPQKTSAPSFPKRQKVRKALNRRSLERARCCLPSSADNAIETRPRRRHAVDASGR